MVNQYAGGMFDAERDAMHIHGKGALEQRAGESIEAHAERLNPGVIDQDVDAAGFFAGRIQHRSDIGLTRYIRFLKFKTVTGRMPVRDEYARASLTETARDRPPDASRTSGHDG